ncbi:MAG: DNA primase [Firmicutes bacterium]|nr:DNA primase [Bacillota bacterium]
MAFISEEEINNIRNEANIVDIISSYISLNKSGSDYVGVCPFHDDHSPSMHVSTKLNIFKCFVCNTGGNVFSFVQKFEKVSYIEAIKIVATKSGLAFNYAIDTHSNSKYKKEFEIMDLSLKFYQNNIATQSGLEAKKYLLGRGIDDKIIKEFKIGLSFNDNKLREFLENKKCDLDTAYNIGLLNKSGIDYYDMFTNRIMIPIFDMQGNLAGYTARAYLKDEKNKYINSKETVIYKKSNILFNYYNAKDIARSEKEMILVEGNMDAISLAVSGIKNVCALMGVVISKNQIAALKRLNAKIILMLDSDSAGSGATLKVGEEIYNEGIDVEVVRLTGAKDPDEYIRSFGVDKLKDNIKHAKKFLDFKLEALKESKNLENIEELTSYIKAVIASLGNASELEREVAIAKICKDYNLDPQVIKNNLTPVASVKKTTVVKEQGPNKKKSRYNLAVEQMIYAMLLNKEYYRVYMNELGYLKNKVERDTVSLIGSYIKQNNTIDISGFIDYIISYEQISDYVNDILMHAREETLAEKEFYDILNTVCKCIDEEEIKELKIKIKNEQDVAKKVELIAKLTELKKGCGNNEGN